MILCLQTASMARALPRTAEDALTFEEAESRKARIGDIHYDLHFDLSGDAEEFSGSALITFDLTTAAEDLTLDCSGGTVSGVILNGSPIEPAGGGFFLVLPAPSLRPGTNTIKVDFRHPYSKDGTGLHRFTDPEDGRTYLYTYLWPYYANRLFPCFDQPNLKATFAVTVTAPRDWIVISTAPGRATSSTDSLSAWTFDTTPRMSTYVFSLHAGPYRVWKDRAGDIPVRLLARQSLSAYVPVDEWFDVTRKGLAYYGRYFDIAYPFHKYDQLIVPDFAIGAMENIAAVTFNEGYVQRRPSTRFERENRANVILHEMSHMWFGDLVTKDWWNGLWLNESFATFMASIAVGENTEFTDTWHSFFVDNKPAAYFRDSRVTTHPIDVPIHSTADFFSVFDAITYQKGSSVLKQLAHFVGDDNFRRGVSLYLKKHAYGNTRLNDFIQSQAETSGRDLDPWARQWLYESGFNSLETKVVCRDGAIDRLTIVQTAPPEHSVLRRHRVDVALYNRDAGGRLTRGRVFDVEVDGRETDVTAARGEPCPALVFPNDGDWSFARVILDTNSVAAIRGHVQDLADPLARSMCLRSLYDMSRQGELDLEDYALLAAEEATRESNPRILAQLTLSLGSTVEMLSSLAPESDAARARVSSKLETLSWERTIAETDPDRQKLWFDLFVGAAESDTALARMHDMLSGRVTVRDLLLSPDLRWQIVMALCTRGASDSEALIAEEEKRDASDLGQKMAIAAGASRPDAGVKHRWLDELSNPQSALGLSRQRFAMFALYPASQSDLHLADLERILGSLPGISSRDPYFQNAYTSSLLKPIGREASSTTLGKALEQSANLGSIIHEALQEACQADRECLKLRGQFVNR